MRFLRAAGVAASVAMSVIGVSQPASAASTSTDWTQEGFNAQHTGANPAETILTRSNVGHLVSAFSTRVNPNTDAITGVTPDPIVAGGVVYLSNSADAYVVAVNATTGALKWRVQPHCFGGTTAPAFAGGQIWIGQDDPGISALSTGGVQISCLPLFDAVGYGSSPPSAGNGTVYAEADDGGVGAVNATTGAILWSNQNVGDGTTPTLSADGRAVFVGGFGNFPQQLLYKLNAATGAVIWSRALGACGDDSTTVAGSMVFLSSCNNLYALSAATGSTVWQVSGSGGRFAVEGGLVFNGAAAYNATNGSQVWSNPTYSGSSPAVANGVVYVDASSKIFMLNSSTGALLGTISLPPSSEFDGAVIPVDGRVYVCSVNDTTGTISLHAYEP
jgi:outer membrane protein assembly factor BamB